MLYFIWGESKMLLDNEKINFEIVDISKLVRGLTIGYTDEKDVSVLSCRISGDGCFEENGIISKYKENDIIFIPKGSTYMQYCKKEEIIYIHMHIQNYSGAFIELYTPNDKRAVRIFEELYYVWGMKERGYKFKCTALVNEIFYILRTDCGKQNARAHMKIEPSLRYMHANLLNPNLSIAEIASKSGVSEVYFRRLFTKELGMSPLKYINSRRIEHAKTLLLSGDYSVNDVADASGFAGYAYFYECFKKHVGISPSEFARGIGNANDDE